MFAELAPVGISPVCEGSGFGILLRSAGFAFAGTGGADGVLVPLDSVGFAFTAGPAFVSLAFVVSRAVLYASENAPCDHVREWTCYQSACFPAYILGSVYFMQIDNGIGAEMEAKPGSGQVYC